MLHKYTVLIICLVSLTVYPQGHYVPPEWQPEVELPVFNSSHSQRGVLYNNMTVTSTGKIIIATVEVDPAITSSGRNYLTYSEDNGESWLSPPVRFTPTDLAVGGSVPKLAVDGNDNIFVVWTAKIPNAVYCSIMDADLNIIVDSVRVAGSLEYNSFTTHVTVDKKNRIHVMWHEGDIEKGDIVESYYSRSVDGGLSFETAQLISDDDGRHSAFPHAEFHRAKGDTLAIAWRDSISSDYEWDVLMVTSTNGGESWSEPFNVTDEQEFNSDPDVVIDDFNRIHIIFHKYPSAIPFYNVHIRYGYSDDLGVTWKPSRFRQISESNKRSFLTEGNDYDPERNIFWAVWKDERDYSDSKPMGDIVVAYSTDRGDSWQSPEFATDWDTLAVGFKAGKLLKNGEYALNYEVANVKDGLSRVFFRRRAVVTSAVANILIAPSEFYLEQNYPNPFNPKTKIGFSIPSTGYADYSSSARTVLKVYDILGNEVANLFDENKSQGRYEVEFDASALASGVYFYRLQSGNFTQTKKLILLR